MKRVVITGVGAVTPVGNDLNTIEHNLYNGNSGITWVEEFNTVHGLSKIDFTGYFDASENHSTDRYTKLSWVAYSSCKSDSKGLVPEGVFFGLGFGGGAVTVEECYNSFSLNKKISPHSLIKSIPCTGAGYISLKEKITGPTITYTTACSASSVALGEAYNKIKLDEINSAVVVGVESLNTKLNANVWRVIGAINEDKDSPSECVKPFSKNRKGTAISEGAVALMLESLDSAVARGAKIYAEVVAYGIATGTETFTKPSKSAQVQVLNKALKNIEKSRVTYINAHGTGTPVGDLIELESIEEVFGEFTSGIPISSTKSVTGHLVGGAGALETLSCLIVLKNNKVIPNHFLEPKDPQISDKIFLPRIPVVKEMDIVLNNSFAFGGTNVVLGFKKWK